MYEHGGYKLEYGCQFVEFDDNWRHRGSGDAWGWVRDVGICSRGRRMRKRSEGEELTECPLRKLIIVSGANLKSFVSPESSIAEVYLPTSWHGDLGLLHSCNCHHRRQPWKSSFSLLDNNVVVAHTFFALGL